MSRPRTQDNKAYASPAELSALWRNSKARARWIGRFYPSAQVNVPVGLDKQGRLLHPFTHLMRECKGCDGKAVMLRYVSIDHLLTYLSLPPAGRDPLGFMGLTTAAERRAFKALSERSIPTTWQGRTTLFTSQVSVFERRWLRWHYTRLERQDTVPVGELPFPFWGHWRVGMANADIVRPCPMSASEACQTPSDSQWLVAALKYDVLAGGHMMRSVVFCGQARGGRAMHQLWADWAGEEVYARFFPFAVIVNATDADITRFVTFAEASAPAVGQNLYDALADGGGRIFAYLTQPDSEAQSFSERALTMLLAPVPVSGQPQAVFWVDGRQTEQGVPVDHRAHKTHAPHYLVVSEFQTDSSGQALPNAGINAFHHATEALSETVHSKALFEQVARCVASVWRTAPLDATEQTDEQRGASKEAAGVMLRAADNPNMEQTDEQPGGSNPWDVVLDEGVS